MEENALAIVQNRFQGDMIQLGLAPGTVQAILAWAKGSSDSSSPRFSDLVNDKSRIVGDFLCFVKKSLELVTPGDVQAYQEDQENRTSRRKGKLAQSTVYGSLSRISAFYEWMMKLPELKDRITRNPVDPVRPKAPKAYQTESTKALTDEETVALLDHVKALGDKGSLAAKRDYAMLLIYFMTGMRREEVCSLRYGDVTPLQGVILNSVTPESGVMKLTSRVKGGNIVTRELKDPDARAAIEDYLSKSERKNLRPEDPLWTRHDRSGKPGAPLSSRSLVENLKRYALEVGITHIHLHQTRHTFAMMVADETGSLTDAQDALGHKNASVTQVYVSRLGTKKDKYSQVLSSRFKKVRKKSAHDS